MVVRCFGADLVVTSANVLYEGVSADDDAGGAMGLKGLIAIEGVVGV